MDGIDNVRFQNARARALGEETSEKGIGTLSEKLIHRILKLYYEPDEGCHEIEYLGSVADIKNENGIIERQTRAYQNLKPKLKKFLENDRVTVVCPVLNEIKISTYDKATGEITTRKSPRKKGLADAAIELYRIKEFLTDAYLTVKLVFLSVEDFREKNEDNKKRPVRDTRIERIPNRIISEIPLRTKEDYRIFLPDTLPEEFLAKDFYKAVRSRTRYTYYALKLCEYLGFIECAGKEGRAFVYRRI